MNFTCLCLLWSFHHPNASLKSEIVSFSPSRPLAVLCLQLPPGHYRLSSLLLLNIKLNYWLLVIDGGAPHLPCSCESARGASRLNEWIYQLNVFYQPPPSLYRAGSFYIHLQFLHSVSCHNAILTIFSGHGHMILALYWALSIPPWLGPTLMLWLEQHSLA